VLPRRFLFPPLYPRLVFTCSSHHRFLGTWSQQGSMVKPLRALDREPLRSTFCRLGFIIESLCWGPGARLSGPTCGPRRPQDPIDGHLPLGLLAPSASWAVVCLNDPIVSGFLGTTRPLSEARPW
jgi:hypothetical protein